MTRHYVIGLPCMVSVDDDGTVTVSVDVTEAHDLYECTGTGATVDGVEYGEGELPLDPVTVDADVERIMAAQAAGSITTSVAR